MTHDSAHWNVAIRRRSLVARAMVVVGAALLIAGHGALLYHIRSHIGISLGALCGVLVIVVIKHLGLLAPLFGHFRRRLRDRVAVDSRRDVSKN